MTPEQFEKILSTARLIVYENDGSTTCVILPSTLTHQHYGIMLADCIRHVAKAFDVSEGDVFEWVEKEMDRKTTKIEGGRRQ